LLPEDLRVPKKAPVDSANPVKKWFSCFWFRYKTGVLVWVAANYCFWAVYVHRLVPCPYKTGKIQINLKHQISNKARNNLIEPIYP
jgi:hypothetical protein